MANLRWFTVKKTKTSSGAVNWLSKEGKRNNCPLPLELHVISLKLTTEQIKVKQDPPSPKGSRDRGQNKMMTERDWECVRAETGILKVFEKGFCTHPQWFSSLAPTTVLIMAACQVRWVHLLFVNQSRWFSRVWMLLVVRRGPALWMSVTP